MATFGASSTSTSTHVDINANMDEIEPAGGTTLGFFNPFHAERGIGDVIKKFSEFLDHLEDNPGEFQYIANEVVMMLHINVNDRNTLRAIATKMVSRAIISDNLAYTGAKLSHKIMASGLHVEEEKFEDIFLDNCHERFRKIVIQYTFPEARSRAQENVRGFTRFFAELFLELKTKTTENGETNEVCNSIGSVVAELLQYYCGTKKDVIDGNILFVSQILKLAGWQLDHSDDDGKLKHKLDSIFLTLRNYKPGHISYDSRTRIEMLEKLRERDWDHEAQDVVSNATPPPESPSKIYELPHDYYLESLTYYNFEERVEEGIYLDDEPEYVAAAYDDFLEDLKEKIRLREAAEADEDECYPINPLIGRGRGSRGRGGIRGGRWSF